VSAAVSLGGWVAAGLVGLVVASLWRTLSHRMEAVARACHELRGPLAAARLGLTPPSGAQELPPGRLRAIDAELGRAALALDDLANPRRPGPHLSGCERLDVHALVSDSVEAWHASALAAGVSLRVRWSGLHAAVWGDRLRLAQATGNLIANAIEHGGGAVEVHGSLRTGTGSGPGRAPAEHIRIVVSDQGPGLPASVAELARRHPRRRRGARGRGLAIASDVALAHGGRLVSAPSERGARLVLELPAAAPGPWRPAR
jgi:signal transduction histidine kinase